MKSFSGRLFSHEKSESWKVKDNFYFQSFMGFYQTLQEIFLEFPMAFFFFFFPGRVTTVNLLCTENQTLPCLWKV